MVCTPVAKDESRCSGRHDIRARVQRDSMPMERSIRDTVKTSIAKVRYIAMTAVSVRSQGSLEMRREPLDLADGSVSRTAFVRQCISAYRLLHQYYGVYGQIYRCRGG